MREVRMKASVRTTYGPPEVLRIEEVAKPVPKQNEVLVRVRATSVNYGDLAARNFKAISARQFNMPFLFWFMAKVYFGIKRPRMTILGNEFAGDIDAVGAEVRTFAPGDKVFGYLGQSMGAYAEFLCMPEGGCVARMPSNMTFDEAAVAPYGAIMALSFLKKAGVEKGQRILIIGASGGIGSAAVQIAKSCFGAEVTGVCGTRRLEFVKFVGADAVIDYTREDFTRNGQTYDLILDTLGKSSYRRCRDSLTEHGRYFRVSFKLPQLIQMAWTAIVGGKRVVCAIAPGSRGDLLLVKELVESKKLVSIIDRRFPLDRTADAHRYVESGDAGGKVAITV